MKVNSNKKREKERSRDSTPQKDSKKDKIGKKRKRSFLFIFLPKLEENKDDF